jgi:hypothetical protein
MDRFYFTAKGGDNFNCYDKDGNQIDSPVSTKTLKEAYQKGLMAFVKVKKNWKKIRREEIDGPWGGTIDEWLEWRRNKRNS